MWTRRPALDGAHAGMVLGLALAASSGALLVTRFAAAPLDTFSERVTVFGALALAGVCVGAIGGAAAGVVVTGIARLRAHPTTWLVAAALGAAGWMLPLLRLGARAALGKPLTISALALSFLAVVAVFQAGQPVRRRSTYAVVAIAGTLPACLLWLNVAVIRFSGDPATGPLNLALLLGAHLLLAALLWLARRRPGRAPGQPGRGAIAGTLALVALCGAGVYPLAVVATAALRPAELAPRPVATPASTWASSPGPRGQGARPNVVLISVDTLRSDALGCYGYPKPTTPNIDRFFAPGVRFERATAASSWTLPSHATMLTGLLPRSHGARVSPIQAAGTLTPIAADRRTLAELLSEAGYRTGAFTGGSFVHGRWGFDRGFEVFTPVPTARFRESVGGALEWLAGLGDEPYFLFVHGFDVHRYAPLQTFDELPEPDYHGPVRALRARATNAVESYCVADGFDTLSAPDIEYLRWLYDTELRHTDGELQRLFEALRRRGELEDTVVILTSDHGEEFFEHGATGHAFQLYQTLLSVPLLIRSPGGIPGEVDEVVSLADIVPTVMHLAGVAPERAGPLDGRSLADLLYGASALPARNALASADVFSSRAALVGERYKLIDNDALAVDPFAAPNRMMAVRNVLEHYHSGIELYDLHRDPGEQENLATEQTETVSTLQAQLHEGLRPLPTITTPRPASPGKAKPDARVDEALEQQLRALGYSE